MFILQNLFVGIVFLSCVLVALIHLYFWEKKDKEAEEKDGEFFKIPGFFD